MKPRELSKVFSGSIVASIWVTGLLTVYCGGAFVLSLARHLEWLSVAFTGMGATMFAVMTAWNIRALYEARRAQSEYSLTAPKGVRRP